MHLTKFVCVAFFFLINFELIFSQENQSAVSIKVSGDGTSIDAARQSALKSAIEQTFGAFVSTKTEVLNDNLLLDEITSVSNGNVISYKTLNESHLPDDRWAVTLEAVVSLNQLTSIVQSKGLSFEFNGNVFALNIKQQLLNEQGEANAIYQMVGLLHEQMQTAFDYEIKSSNPKQVDAESKFWAIPLTVSARANKNMEFCANYCINTLASLTLSKQDMETYLSLNKPVYLLCIEGNGTENIYYLRNENSAKALHTLMSNWGYYNKNFTIIEGTRQLVKIFKENPIHKFSEKYYLGNKIDIYRLPKPIKQVGHIIFPSFNSETYSYLSHDTLSLTQVSQVKGYSAKGLGVLSPFKEGGFVFKGFEGGFRIGLGLSQNIVDNLLNDWPAAKAGIKLGDKVVSVNGKNLIGLSDLVSETQKGASIKLEIERNGIMIKYTIQPTYVPSVNGFSIALYDITHKVNGSQNDQEKISRNEAEKKCNELILGGYNDWRLPTGNELEIMYDKLIMECVGNFETDDFYNRASYEAISSNSFIYNGGYANTELSHFNGSDENYFFVRAVRSIKREKNSKQNLSTEKSNITSTTNAIDSSIFGGVEKRKNQTDANSDEKVFEFVEVTPEFPGGEVKLMKFISSNIRYPEMERDNDIQGIVQVKFIVNTDGSVSDIVVVKSVSPGLDNEAIRIAKMLPKFSPAIQTGKAVRAYYKIPVVFKLQ